MENWTMKSRKENDGSSKWKKNRPENKYEKHISTLSSVPIEEETRKKNAGS